MSITIDPTPPGFPERVPPVEPLPPGGPHDALADEYERRQDNYPDITDSEPDDDCPLAEHFMGEPDDEFDDCLDCVPSERAREEVAAANKAAAVSVRPKLRTYRKPWQPEFKSVCLGFFIAALLVALFLFIDCTGK